MTIVVFTLGNLKTSLSSPCITCVQYRGGIQYRGDIMNTMGVFSTVGDIMGTVGGYHEYRGGLS